VDGILATSLLNSGRMKRDFVQFKFWWILRGIYHWVSFNMENLITSYSDQSPDFWTLAHILCLIPLTSMRCERGFIVQNRLNPR
jgi:hypothetical protein